MIELCNPRLLKDFKKLINKASRYAGTTNPKVIFYIGETAYQVQTIVQGHIIPDVIITLKKII